jgi:cytochrome P450
MSNLLADPVSATVIAGIFIFFAFYFYFNVKDEWSKIPGSIAFYSCPGPPRLPFIGNYQILDTNRNFAFHTFLKDATEQYGKIVRFGIGRGKTVLICDADEAKRVFTNTNEFQRADALQNIWRGIAHYALFLIPSGSSEWKKHRKSLQPAFGPMILRHVVEKTDEVAKVLVKYLDKQIEENDVACINIHEFFTGLGLDVSMDGLNIGDWKSCLFV